MHVAPSHLLRHLSVLTHSETTFYIFVLFKERSKAMALIVKPENSFSCTGINTDFFQFMTNPMLQKEDCCFSDPEYPF